jgi:inward rectifier potassium channel
MRVTLVQNMVTQEGEFMRRFFDMRVARSQTPIFALTWTVMHPIDEQSPLYGMTAQDLVDVEAELIITLNGIDDTFSQTIYARHSYIPSEILWNSRFADILTRTVEGKRAIDYSRFHEVKPLP